MIKKRDIFRFIERYKKKHKLHLSEECEEHLFTMIQEYNEKLIHKLARLEDENKLFRMGISRDQRY